MTSSLFSLSPLWNDLLDQAGLMAAVLRPDGFVVHANRSLRAACGWPDDAIEGLDWGARCRVQGAATSHVLAAWMDGSAPVGAVEARVGRADAAPGDGERVVMWHAAAMRDASGRPEGLALIGLDVTAERALALERIEHALARSNAETAARERDVQLAGIVETALDAIITVDAALRIVFFNAAAVRMFGVDAREACGGGIDRFIPEPLREAHRAHMARYARDGLTSRRMGNTRELTGRRADGQIFPIEASISRAGEGERLLMTVMARDVTQLRQAEQAQAARMAAEAASQAKTEFLSRISHELRTPLNAVLGFAELMRMDAGEARDTLGARQHERIEQVLQAARHLRTVVDEMLDVAGIESGRMTVAVRDVELRALVDGVIRMSAPHAAKCGVLLDAGPPRPGSLWIRSDPDRLRQILLNLLSNAIKYSRRGGAVGVELSADHVHVRIVVRDEGIGMSPQQMAQLFQPFNRLGREASGVPGSGIGLVLVRQLVTLLGGDLDIRSEPERGTTVEVLLPAIAGSPAPADLRGLAMPGDERIAGRVLYIEDNAVNVMLVEQLLERWPAVQLVVAGDGGTGVERACALRPDVVLLDMQLPDMSGVEVLRRLRARETGRGLRVVALSASALPAEVAAARAEGALDYWTKPIDFASFIEGMRTLLRK